MGGLDNSTQKGNGRCDPTTFIRFLLGIIDIVSTSLCFHLESHPFYPMGSNCNPIGITSSQASEEDVKKNTIVYELCMEWFAMKLYDLFHKQFGNGPDIEIEIESFKQCISRSSLECIVTAYHTIAQTHRSTGGEDNKELSLTAPIAVFLQKFMHSNASEVKILHQMPIYGHSERPDWLALPTSDDGCLLLPVVKSTMVSDFKPSDLAKSKIETFAYCSRLVEEKVFRKFIALCCTCHQLEMYLVTGLNLKLGRIKICQAAASNNDEMMHFFYVLYAAVNYLTHHCFEADVPYCSPIPGLEFTGDDLLSASHRLRVFVHDGFVYKLYDTSSTSKPNVDILKNFEYFMSLSLHDLNGTGRFKCLKYQYLDGDHVSRSKGGFIVIAKILLKLHRLGYVHGDIRDANVIFGNENAWIIDFDICDKENALYPVDYNHNNISERHSGARAQLPMKKDHDIYSLIQLIKTSSVGLGVHGNLSEIIDQLRFSTLP